MRLGQDVSDGAAGTGFVLGALAVLPESAALASTGTSRVEASAGGTWGLVPESHAALRQQTWQVCSSSCVLHSLRIFDQLPPVILFFCFI